MTSIEWSDATWNPVTGCSKVSPGCDHCYAESMALGRLKGRFGYPGLPWTPENSHVNVVLHPDRLGEPLRWRNSRGIFVNSMSDLFHREIPDEFIATVFSIMLRCPQHIFQILTKRPDRALAWFDWMASQPLSTFFGVYMVPLESKEVRWPLPNVWIGVSVENQMMADARLPVLIRIPAAKRFASVEPLLEEVNILPWLGQHAGLDWVIVGGESGPLARPCDLSWIRTVVKQCRETHVPCFVNTAAIPANGLEDLRVREFPNKEGSLRTLLAEE